MFYFLKESQEGREQYPASVPSSIPVSRGCLFAGAEGRLCCVFLLQFHVPCGAGFSFPRDRSSFPQRVTLKKNTFPLPALPQEVAGPQQFLGHFTCRPH